MSATQYALLALLLYTLLNVMLDKYFSHIDPLITLSIYCAIILTLALSCIARNYHNSVVMVVPSTKIFIIICLCGMTCFFADSCYLTAYNKGGSLASITTIVAIMPVFAVVIKMFMDRKLPELSQFLGCILATMAVYLVTRK